MGIVSDFFSQFSWYKSKENTSNPTKRQPRRPEVIDFTDSLQCNSALTKGLYHNSYPGMKLAGSMCYTPIAVPIWLMGIPVATSKDKKIQKILDEITNKKTVNFYENHKQSHRDGTSWIFPFYSATEDKIIWEFIQDETISDIIRDLITGKVIKIITDEQITVSIGYNQTATVRRKRTFTQSKITIEYTGSTGIVPTELKDKTQRNTFGIMPIPFANNKDADETRGHSDYERVLSDLKNYHDIDLNESQMLAKFVVKMVQYISDRDKWLENNGYKTIGVDDADITNLDISTIDLIFNIMGSEDTKYIFPEGAYTAYEAKLRNIFRKIVEGSGIPEILWGTKVEGNKASADQQMDLVVKLVEDKRMQKTDQYKRLYEDSIRLELSASLQTVENYEIKIEWNKLDAVSEETKSIILKNFAEAVNRLTSVAGITKQQVWELWKQLNPTVTEDKYKDFVKGLTEMASHYQFSQMNFELAADFQGLRDIDTDIELEDVEEIPEVEETPPEDGNGNGNGEAENTLKIIQDAIKNRKLKLK